MSFVVAVGGATGNVGREMLRILEQRQFPIASLVPLATAESAAAGRCIEFRGRPPHAEAPTADADLARGVTARQGA